MHRASRGIGAGVLVALLSGGANLSLAGWLPELIPPLRAIPNVDAQLLPQLVPPLVPEPPPGPTPPPGVEANPLEAPLCAELSLTAVTESPDHRASLATLRRPGQDSGVTLGFHGRVADARVVYVGDNPHRQSPAVWLLTRGGLCQVVLRRGAVRPPAAPAREPSGVGDRIERIAEGQYRVDRMLLESALSHPESLGARLDLSTRDGQRGLRLASVDPRGLLGQLGLKSGDRLESINGHALGDAESALAALARLAGASVLRARVVRQGRPLTWTAQIQ